MKYVCFMASPIGQIGIAQEGEWITNLFFGGTVQPEAFEIKETPLLIHAIAQLKEYFSGIRTSFSLPLQPRGSEFELAVWQELQKIPYGETRSYKEIAVQLGKPSSSRAVGRANSKNPISIIIPCHRVIGTNGKLTGYAGGLSAKEYLLGFEKSRG